jgi:Flp pilus assembly protein TadG
MKTIRTFRPVAIARAKGVASIELALILLALVGIIIGTFIPSYMLWKYNVARNVVTLGASYAAAGTWADLKTGTRRTDAENLIRAAAAEAGLSISSVVVLCPPAAADCGNSSKPPVVKAFLRYTFDDSLFADWLEGYEFAVWATVPFQN